MLSFAALFPGQGSQYPGMSKVLTDNFPWTSEIYEEASEAIKVNLLKLSAEGPADELQLTYNAQPAILTTSTAWFRVLQKNLDFKPTAGAGHSLGEYSALVASGTLTLTEAVKLVRKRGELMQSAVKPGEGKMAAVIGLADDVISQVCEAASLLGKLVVPANFNAPSQVVVAGHAEAVDKFTELAKGVSNPQWKARKVIPLNVSAPFHCPLMKSTAEAFSPFLQSVNWQPQAFPIVSNVDAQLRASGSMVEILRDQIDHPVLWTACVKTLERLGNKRYLEVGPSRVLTGLVKRITDGAEIFSLDSLEEFQAFEKLVNNGGVA